jgi:hypothetical protein
MAYLGDMRAQPTQADIAIEALKLGAGLSAVAKWVTRGIPDSWRWKLRESFTAKQLEDFRSLPEKKA